MKGRWAFHGSRDAQMEERYVWKDVSAYPPLGLRTPVRYDPGLVFLVGVVDGQLREAGSTLISRSGRRSLPRA
jgi:hypothetical protein